MLGAHCALPAGRSPRPRTMVSTRARGPAAESSVAPASARRPVAAARRAAPAAASVPSSGPAEAPASKAERSAEAGAPPTSSAPAAGLATRMLAALDSALGPAPAVASTTPSKPTGWAPPLPRQRGPRAAAAGTVDPASLAWRPHLRLPAPARGGEVAAAAAVAAAPCGSLAPPASFLTLPLRPPGPGQGRSTAAREGDAWFALPSPAVDGALKTDLRLLHLRGALDPTRHYRNADSTKLPSRFHIGTVVEGATEFFSARLARTARGASLADELLRDAGANAVRKRRYAALQEAAGSGLKRGGRKTAARRERAKPKRVKR